MECRMGCGACCIAPSISSPIPGMPQGKPANTRCIHLSDDNLCNIFGQPERPKVCDEFSAQSYVCGNSREEALILLTQLEVETSEQ
ncbi:MULTISPECIES: YkgJ family cysteine cluster protein [Gammaproteobacteria]|uniref:YkgJ family cysteine cluster protein n=1 Tax=Gammaproteobacteria TaxID=1236 RepID=UPI000DD067FD|nr:MULTISPECIES: YkgJ family cysteine cluster protein [Gammaproteobacteria]RTE86509.1 YkgJ family cysteine cluster protein [Aliidiomarina sp. B3213]TCZ90936.1 YkgJ family cysteine cluster protein [Lysobacter sp. N42]